MQAKNFVFWLFERAAKRQQRPDQDIAARTSQATNYCSHHLYWITWISHWAVNQLNSSEEKLIWEKFDRQVIHHFENVEQHRVTMQHREHHVQELDKFITEHVFTRSSCQFKWSGGMRIAALSSTCWRCTRISNHTQHVSAQWKIVLESWWCHTKETKFIKTNDNFPHGKHLIKIVRPSTENCLIIVLVQIAFVSCLGFWRIAWIYFDVVQNFVFNIFF